MRTSDLTPRQHIKHLLIQPPFRERVRLQVVRGYRFLSRNRIEIALVAGIAFGMVFAVLSGVACTSSL